MGKSNSKFSEETLLLVFSWTHIALMFLLPQIWQVNINLWTQLLAYAGGFLLGIQVLGDKRIRKADRTLAANARHISRMLNRFLLFYYLVNEEEKGDRREIAAWYLFGLLDLLLWIAFLKLIVPVWLGITAKEFFQRYMSFWKLYLLIVLPTTITLLTVLLRRVIRKLPALGKILHFLFYATWIPGALLFGWITIPWLLIVGLSWVVLQSLVAFVYFRNKWNLGNIFYVIGFASLMLSFVLFIIEKAHGGG